MKMQYDQINQERTNALNNKINQLTQSQQLPQQQFSDLEVQHLLTQLSLSDSNNFQKAGAGEREGRVFSCIVKQRNFGFAHGVGRSGNLLDQQPKAAGSNILHQLTRNLVKHALQLRGFQAVKNVLITPVATGMTFNFVLQALGIKSVIWLRCDQKSIPKAIELAGVKCYVVECLNKENTSMQTDYQQLEQYLTQTNDADAIISTSSCFAPRQPDDLKYVSKLCKKYNKKHLVNNAYGIQSDLIMNELNVCENIDLVVSSLDKNFLVPVGGAIVYSRNQQIIEDIGKKYAGRASSQQIIDLFITLIQMGVKEWKQLHDNRKQLFQTAQSLLNMQIVPRNEISMYKYVKNDDIGTQLFRRGISGSRVNKLGSKFQFCGNTLQNFNCHSSSEDTICNYIVFAAAIGVEEEDINVFKQVFQQIEKVE